MVLEVVMGTTDLGKTKTELVKEVAKLKRQNKLLTEKGAERNRIEEHLRSLTHDLSERVKELDCLYNISGLLDRKDLSWDETLQGIVEFLPEAWHYPESTCARLRISGKEIKSMNFRRTNWRLIFNLQTQDNKLGTLEVFSFKKKVKKGERRFLEEEQKLLNVIGERLSYLVEQHQEHEQAEQQQQQLVQLDKMVALGVLVSGVAHEINNPNNFIMLNTPLLEDAWQSIIPILDRYFSENGDFLLGGLLFSEIRDTIPRLFAGITEGSQRIKSIVDSLKRFSRVDPSEMTHGIDVNALTKSAVTLINNHIQKSTEHLNCSYGKDLPLIKGHFQRLEQVVINLLHNACDALPDRNSAISVTTLYDRKNRCVIIEIRDEGIGIPADKLSNIQDPFYTTKRDQGGTGLGLSVSSSIVKNHGGKLLFSSAHGRGTTATIVLPVTENDITKAEADP
ncbi:MAG TPA: ATP-binding protein [Myxococcota bacterium]|nr:ATP-binding protein [Myxococcota bacterium]